MLREFRAFIMRGNVLDLAVAVIIGAAFLAVVDAFADGILMNLVAAVFGQPSFNSITVDVGDGQLLVGRFLTAVVNFLVIAFALFLIIRAVRAMEERRRRGRAPADEAPPPSDEAVLLAEIRDLLAGAGPAPVPADAPPGVPPAPPPI